MTEENPMLCLSSTDSQLVPPHPRNPTLWPLSFYFMIRSYNGQPNRQGYYCLRKVCEMGNAFKSQCFDAFFKKVDFIFIHSFIHPSIPSQYLLSTH